MTFMKRSHAEGDLYGDKRLFTVKVSQPVNRVEAHTKEPGATSPGGIVQNPSQDPNYAYMIFKGDVVFSLPGMIGRRDAPAVAGTLNGYAPSGGLRVHGVALEATNVDKHPERGQRLFACAVGGVVDVNNTGTSTINPGEAVYARFPAAIHDRRTGHMTWPTADGRAMDSKTAGRVVPELFTLGVTYIRDVVSKLRQEPTEDAIWKAVRRSSVCSDDTKDHCALFAVTTVYVLMRDGDDRKGGNDWTNETRRLAQRQNDVMTSAYGIPSANTEVPAETLLYTSELTTLYKGQMERAKVGDALTMGEPGKNFQIRIK